MYLRGSVRLVSADVSYFLPYRGAENCTLYLLLDLQLYLISDLLCNDADINPLWFLLVFPDASRVDFSLVVCVSGFQYMHVNPKHAQVLFSTGKHNDPI